MKRNTYFTLINTCCYSGGWTNIATAGLGNRFVHSATSATTTAQNFKTISGKYRGGVFVTALLECLRKSPDNTLSQFTAEISQDVIDYRSPAFPDIVPAAPKTAVNNTKFWKQKLDAFIPIHRDSTLHETVTTAVSDINANLRPLFSPVKSPKRRKVISECSVTEILSAQATAEHQGGSNGEGDIYNTCQKVLNGDADDSTERALLRTVSWREIAILQAQQIARHLEDIGLIEPEVSVCSDEVTLSKQGRSLYTRAFSESVLINKTKIPPRDCIGGHYEKPYIWLSNRIARSNPTISKSHLKSEVEGYLTDIISADEEASQISSRIIF